MVSATFERTVNRLVDDRQVTDDDIFSAIEELDLEFRKVRAECAPVQLERYKLREILRAVARERGLGRRGLSAF